ncbi:hypothetical protein HMPREF9431_00638 [Segatella oulorum F0390]|uniref:Uncharacterized protein n=1 Tax=Segatella oulorum F0390 TaxID=702438 RepID=G1W9Y7_9BACT|nr:hypothetical protein HMPREF9431_00638 [Segatella oulorum F0390]
MSITPFFQKQAKHPLYLVCFFQKRLRNTCFLHAFLKNV